MTDYILMAQERVLVEHFGRQDNGGWLLRFYNRREQQIELPELDIILPLTELYDGVEVPDGLLPLHEEAPDTE